MKLFLLVVLCWVVVSARVQFGGVNLSGAEFGNSLPGTYNTDYTYPTSSEVDYFVSKGMNLFRLPFLWERLQRSQFGSFDQTEQGRLTTLVNYITNTKGKYVLLDPHNYARYNGQVVGQGVPVAAFADFWTKLSNVFKANSKVIFGLMNEPKEMDSLLWASDAQAAILAIRATGATNMITVPGNGYTGAWSWTPGTAWYGTANSIALASINDPLNNFIFEVHQYLDSDSSGTNPACSSSTIGSQRLQSFTNWARQNNKKAILGEFGAGSSVTCLSAVDDMLSYMDSNTDVWVGWTWWAAGPWWGDYFTSIEPANGQDKPQMTPIARHLPATGPVGSSTTGRPQSTTGRTQSTTARATTGRPATTTGRPATTTGRPATTTGRASTTSGGQSTGGNPCGNPGIPTNPDSVAFSQAPFMIPNSGTVSVTLVYSVTTSRVIVIDLLNYITNQWYGKGVVTVQSGTGTVSVSITIENQPPLGPYYQLHAWVVSVDNYNNQQQPWNYAITSTDSKVSVAGTGTIFSQSVTPCDDTQPCVSVCGTADNVDICDCDETGHVTVVCKGTDSAIAPAASTSGAEKQTQTPFLLLLLTTVFGMLAWVC